MDHVHRAHVDQLDELLLQEDVLAGEDRDVGGIADLLHQLAVLPRHHVLHPREVVLLHRLRETDAAVDADVAVVVRRQRNLHPDHVAYRAHPVGQPRDAGRRDLDAGERMGHASALPDARAERRAQHAGLVAQQADAEVLLQVGDAAIHALLQPPALLLRIVGLRSCRHTGAPGRGTCRRASATPARPTPCRRDPCRPSRRHTRRRPVVRARRTA